MQVKYKWYKHSYVAWENMCNQQKNSMFKAIPRRFISALLDLKTLAKV